MWMIQIFYKELLSLRPLILVGLATFTVALMGMQGSKAVSMIVNLGSPAPFLSNNFLTVYFFIAYPLAGLFGYWTTLWEFGRGTWLFLLHRPRPVTQIIFVKMLSVLILLMVITAMPALIFAWYVSRPGVEVLPFEWRFTFEFWRFWLLTPIVYLGAFCSGLSDGRWYGSRLLPIAFTVAAIFFCIAFPFFFPWSFWIAQVIFLWLLVTTAMQETKTRDFS